MPPKPKGKSRNAGKGKMPAQRNSTEEEQGDGPPATTATTTKARRTLSFSEDMEEEIVEWYRSVPHLWDRSTKDYKDEAMRTAAFTKKAAELHVDVADLRRWIKDQRDLFTRAARNKKTVPSGSGARKPLTHRKKLNYERFKFLEQHVVHRREEVNPIQPPLLPAAAADNTEDASRPGSPASGISYYQMPGNVVTSPASTLSHVAPSQASAAHTTTATTATTASEVEVLRAMRERLGDLHTAEERELSTALISAFRQFTEDHQRKQFHAEFKMFIARMWSGMPDVPAWQFQPYQQQQHAFSQQLYQPPAMQPFNQLAPPMQQQYNQPPPAMQQQYNQPPAAVQQQHNQPPPAVQQQHNQPPPAVQQQHNQPPPAVQQQPDQPPPAVQQQQNKQPPAVQQQPDQPPPAVQQQPDQLATDMAPPTTQSPATQSTTTVGPPSSTWIDDQGILTNTGGGPQSTSSPRAGRDSTGSLANISGASSFFRAMHDNSSFLRNLSSASTPGSRDLPTPPPSDAAHHKRKRSSGTSSGEDNM